MKPERRDELKRTIRQCWKADAPSVTDEWECMNAIESLIAAIESDAVAEAQLAVEEKTCAECQREAEIENRNLTTKVDTLTERVRGLEGAAGDPVCNFWIENDDPMAKYLAGLAGPCRGNKNWTCCATCARKE